MGVKVTSTYWTMGRYDLVLIADASEDEAVAAVSIKLGSLGNVSIETLRAFTATEVDNILKKVG
jgi:uncharacterized protein with GYD domain